MTAKNLMVVGTASSAGKSLVVTALCRALRRRGLAVAPFKSQNMSLNSFVTAEGREMGRAQVAQAEAAGLEPSALMNPILLKPTTDGQSQVIVDGRAVGNMAAAEYYRRKGEFLPRVMAAYRALAGKYDAVVIEGAGSPAEINLMGGDFVNMGLSALVGAPVLLVGDIDRGGVFAALYGTVKLLPPADQARIKGLIVNKFRGDPAILEPGLRQLEGLLGLPVLGVLPYRKFALDEEDSLTESLSRRAGRGEVNVAVVRLPRLSNFTDFAALEAAGGVAVGYAETPADLAAADVVIIPGSKNTLGDMRFLRESGLAGEIKALAAAGRAIVGICGGFQILGRAINDPLGVESDLGTMEGLGLLDVETTMAAEKRTVQTALTLREAPGALAGCGGETLAGYEIHMGETSAGPGAAPLADRPGLGAVNGAGNVIGTYLHGFFDNLNFTRKFLGNVRAAKGLPPLPAAGGLPASYGEFKGREYDRLADMLEESLPMAKIMGIMEKGA